MVKMVPGLQSDLQQIQDKVINNKRLSKQDGLLLYECNDIMFLAKLADLARINRFKANSKHDEINYVYWINNHHLNLSNICEGNCKFCAFRKEKSQKGAFSLSLDQAVEYIKTKVSPNASEIHIVSSLNPDYDLNFYKNLFKKIKKILPNIHIQALTPVEIDYIAKIEKLTPEHVLCELIDVGLGSLPGGGAEMFSAKIREKLCPNKISGYCWLKIMDIAHSLGLKSNATMLTGIGETSEDKIDHMLAIRDVQDKTNGFMSFIPLVCHYDNTGLTDYKKLSNENILKNFAIARLILDNINYLKSFWIQIGINLVQKSLSYGVNDIDGTVIEEKISYAAGAGKERFLTESKLIEIVEFQDKIPVERDTLYNIIKVYN